MAVLPTGIGPVTGGYQIERSLRFNSADSTYLNRTPASASNQKTWTWSGWVKRSTLGALQNIFNPVTGGDGSNESQFKFNADDTIQIYDSGTSLGNFITTQVFRDASAWYHIVVALDTTQATSTNRFKLYVNGTQITAFSTASYPSQNTDWGWNRTVRHDIGRYAFGSTQYFNGYMTEINFVDGQALTPSSFGETDSATGVWKPKAFSGTYGTNGFYLPFKTASQWSGYFDGNGDDLTAPSNAAFTYGTGDFTIEGFFFFTGGVGAGGYSYLFAQGGVVGSNSTIGVYAQSGVYKVWNGSTVITGTAAFAQNQWVHIALTRSGTTLRLFVNGVLDGSATNSNSIASGGTSGISIGRWRDISDTNYITGYVSNFRVVKGTAVYTSAFTPPTSQLTAITNTSLLTCQSSTFVDNSTNAFTITTNGDARTQQFSPFTLDVTDDHSGQGNNWQPNNLDLRTTGVGADIMVDTPTNYGTDTGVGGTVRGNYCTMNPLTVPTLPTLANGNLNVSVSATGVKIAQGTFQFPSSGKWYYECTFNNASSSVNGMFIGITSPTRGPNVTRSTAGAYFFYAASSGLLNSNGTDIVTGLSTISANEVFKLAVDIDNSKVWIGRGSTWYNSSGGTTGDPAAGTNPTFSISAIGLTPMSGFDASSVSLSMNFGQRSFNTTAPSGFKALCTQNLPTPTIGATSTTQAGKYFNPILYTGDGTAPKSFTGVGFQPDLVWIKARNAAYYHHLTDAVRGANKSLYSNATDAEATSNAVSAFGSDGFTINNTDVNGSGVTYVAWNWNAGGSTVTNTSGTISAQVRANTTSGFSVVTYTGTGANATVGHGLGVAPDMIIVKNRTNAGQFWAVGHSSLTSWANGVYLNSTAAQASATTLFNSTAPTSTVFSVGTSGDTNGSTHNMVAYCFDSVAGYSAFGSYVGNGSADGPFTYTGFRPRYVMVKRIDSTGDWYVYDTARNPSNLVTQNIFADLAAAESTYAAPNPVIDILSNGFKQRGTYPHNNASGGTYIYMAFAENPFKYSLAR